MNSWLLEFQFKSNVLSSQKEKVFDEIIQILGNSIGKCHKSFSNFQGNGVVLLSDNKNLNILLQAKDNGLMTVDIHNSDTEAAIPNSAISKFRDLVLKLPSSLKPNPAPNKFLPPLKRGRPFSTYDVIGGRNTLVERDFDRVVFDDVSDYQHVQIFHSEQYGNCLYLDNDLNLAESDLEYTRAITGFDREDYAGKTVLILGGGDGGILHYLRDKGPSMITMIDIDQMVIDAAKIHLRGICFDALDSLTGKNYEVIVDDCINHMKSYIEKNQTFDFVINDLTAIPVSTEPVGDVWDFLRLILKLSMKVLNDKGKYFTQGNSVLNSSALKMYENQLEKLEVPVKFSKKTVTVPSYMENWVFYAIWKDV